MEVDRKNETMWRASHAQVFSFRCWDCFAIRIVFRSICFFVFGSCHSLVFSFRLLFFLVFLSFFVSFSHRFSFSMYLGYQCTNVVFVVFNTIAWHGIVHSACCITASYLFVDVLWPQSWYISNMNNPHGHWMCSKLTARNKASMGTTYSDETVGRGSTKCRPWSHKMVEPQQDPKKHFKTANLRWESTMLPLFAHETNQANQRSSMSNLNYL